MAEREQYELVVSGRGQVDLGEVMKAIQSAGASVDRISLGKPDQPPEPRQRPEPKPIVASEQGKRKRPPLSDGRGQPSSWKGEGKPHTDPLSHAASAPAPLLDLDALDDDDFEELEEDEEEEPAPVRAVGKAPAPFGYTPTPVWDAFWYFAAERHRIWQKRSAGDPPPWTPDAILQQYKFTNVFRVLDRSSQFLLSNVQPFAPEGEPTLQFFRTMLYKIFNLPFTWQWLVGYLQSEPTYDNFDLEMYAKALDGAVQQGHAIYSPAYVMPSSTGWGYKDKHRSNLHMLDQMIKSGIVERLLNFTKMEDAYRELRNWHGVGDFLAYQWVQDLNYSDHFEWRAEGFVMPGPGAVAGVRKCFGNQLDSHAAPADIIVWAQKNQEECLVAVGEPIISLALRPLGLIDIQNVFCSIDSYARQAFPSIKVGSPSRQRSKIKHTYDPAKAAPLPELHLPGNWASADI